jgi:hypothetical protein
MNNLQIFIKTFPNLKCVLLSFERDDLSVPPDPDRDPWGATVIAEHTGLGSRRADIPGGEI